MYVLDIGSLYTSDGVSAGLAGVGESEWPCKSVNSTRETYIPPKLQGLCVVLDYEIDIR